MRAVIDNTNRKATTTKRPAPQRSRSRRERRSEAARRPVMHLVMPGLEVARAEIKPRETIAAFLRRTGWATKDQEFGWQFRSGLPTVLEVNGECVLRKKWRTTRIAAADVVRFVSYPLGGGGSSGGKQVIGLVALIAVAAFAAVVTGGAAAGLLGPSFGAGTFGATALGAGIGIGGALLINALERKTGVGNQCDHEEQRSAHPDGRRSLPGGRDAFVDRPEGEPNAAPVLRGGVQGSAVRAADPG